jgi:hypothetical protein
MLFYDWEKIFDTSEGNPKTMYTLLKMVYLKEIPANKYDKLYKYSTKSFIGTSFLVHPDVLLYNAYKYSYREIAQYVALASLRSYADYAITGDTTLDLNLVEIPVELFNENSLLRVKNDKVHFKYEEVKQKDIH